MDYSMVALKSLFVYDLSAMVLMVIIAYLSRRLGEALKIPAYYRVLYATAALLLVAAILDAVVKSGTAETRSLVMLSMILRVIAGCTALFVCLPYWKWLFTEYFHIKR